ncbi:hypothetical protein M0R45_013762 [Rubus argutus]|uniref:Wall-associated receptor kinase galacturonan-binding domain-containing protein n=1 Tax=Rubus argutus TaxID=59490 RepID=A0AAW1XJR4_RUBAR
MALHGRMLLLQLSLVTLLLAAATTRMLAAAQALPNCNEKCGDIPVPYPFGLTDGCFLHVPGQDADDQPFKITCNHNTAPPSLQFLSSDTYASNVTDITNISVGEGELQVMVATSRNCYINNTCTPSLYRPSVLNLPPSYTISEKNKLISIGCNKVAMLEGYLQQVTDPEQPFSVGFSGMSLCQNEFGKRFPETCTDFGCSMNPVPSGMKKLHGGSVDSRYGPRKYYTVGI